MQTYTLLFSRFFLFPLGNMRDKSLLRSEIARLRTVAEKEGPRAILTDILWAISVYIFFIVA